MSDELEPTGGTPAGGGAPAGGSPAAPAAPAAPAPKGGEPAPAAPAAPATLAAGAGGEDTKIAVPVDWPEDWRNRLAGSNKEHLKELDRYDSPQGLWRKVKNLEKAINQKTIDRPRPPDDDAEALTAWRAERGIPASPEEYIEKLQLANGKELGDLDRPIAESYAKFAFENDIPQAVVNKNIDWYYSHLEGQFAQRMQEDAVYRDNARKELLEEFGAEFQPRINALSLLFKDAPEGLMDIFYNARTADDRLLGDVPDVVRWLSSTLDKVEPGWRAQTYQGGDGGMKGLEQRIAEIETRMHTDRAGYFKDNAMQEEYRQLLAERDRTRSRAA